MIDIFVYIYIYNIYIYVMSCHAMPCHVISTRFERSIHINQKKTLQEHCANYEGILTLIQAPKQSRHVSPPNTQGVNHSDADHSRKPTAKARPPTVSPDPTDPDHAVHKSCHLRHLQDMPRLTRILVIISSWDPVLSMWRDMCTSPRVSARSCPSCPEKCDLCNL